MTNVGIVGGGPEDMIPALYMYNENMIWIGADRGNLYLLNQRIIPNYAVGDFDSITKDEWKKLQTKVKNIKTYPVEKDQTDLELALKRAIDMNPEQIYMFGVTGGRLDHELINIQLLYQLSNLNGQIRGMIIDKKNHIELKRAGVHIVEYDEKYGNLSLIPQTPQIKNLTLKGFYYPLTNATLEFGSTLSTSNRLIGKKGTFSFDEGILLVVRSDDVHE
ncbi:thiamine pyrophosphokinase [Salinibacillus kushneri]|uniref:Thiamine diphosphokinase n=1 Tax=Salinibacillus kushneri TaxID=237682 RepID=A0A1I0HLY8_9BACI|nr:thiamine diphosphokinase [Salinibacillus kushneri]SET84183.1 thiamine pyrophosphokinase [Salinibacillus kushneri]